MSYDLKSLLRVFTLAFLLLLISILSSQSIRADEKPSYQAVTANPDIRSNELVLRLMPLTQDELEVESDAWMQLLKEKISVLAEKKVARETADKTDKADKADKAKHEKEMTLLIVESNAVAEKFEAVLTAWKRKGGDEKKISEYKKYLTVVHLEGVKATETVSLLKAMKAWIFSLKGGGRFAINVFVLIIAWLVLLGIAKFVAHRVRKTTAKVRGMSRLLADFLVKFARFAIIVLGVLIILSMFDIDMRPLFALVGGGSFIIAFAAQSTLSNFAAGLMIMIYTPFDVGDVVILAGITGKVKEMSLVSTTIVTADNQHIIIPNSNAWGSVITNINRSDTRRVDLVFGTSYEDDMDKAQRLIEEVVNNHPLVLKDPEPVIRLHELADSSVNYICRPWAKTSDYWSVYWDITRQVKERFDDEGISIPYPKLDVHLETQPSSEQV